MPKRTPQDWETLEQELHAAGVSPAEIEAGPLCQAVVRHPPLQ